MQLQVQTLVMDATQLNQFLQHQQSLLVQMQRMMERHDENAVQNSRSNTVQNNIVNAALLPNFETFDIKETYKNYIQRFKNYVEMKGISSNKEYCAKLLLNSIGVKIFNMVAALASPKPINTIAYDELLTLLEDHLSPNKNVLVA